MHPITITLTIRDPHEWRQKMDAILWALHHTTTEDIGYAEHNHHLLDLLEALTPTEAHLTRIAA